MNGEKKYYSTRRRSKRKTRFGKFKAWLESNKIIFETIVAITLGFIVVYLSIQANNIAEKQIEISEIQNQIAFKQNSPIVIVNAEQIYDENVDLVSDIQITISNDGSPVKEFTKEYISILNVEFTEYAGSSNKVVIPVNNYFGFSTFTKNSTGLLYTIFGNNNNTKMSKLKRNFLEFATSKNAFGFLRMQTCVKTNYKDIFNNQHEKYYLVDLFWTREISKEEGEKYFKYIRTVRGHSIMLEFEKTNSEEILNKLNYILKNPT